MMNWVKIFPQFEHNYLYLVLQELPCEPDNMTRIFQEKQRLLVHNLHIDRVEEFSVYATDYEEGIVQIVARMVKQ